MGGRPLGLWAYDVLKKQPGIPMTIYEIVDRINGDQEPIDGQLPATNSNVSSALAKLMRENHDAGLTRPSRGLYMFSPDKQRKEEEIYRAIKVYDDGRVIMEGTDGELYLGQRIDTLWGK